MAAGGAQALILRNALLATLAALLMESIVS
jgi:hypothetical protein